MTTILTHTAPSCGHECAPIQHFLCLWAVEIILRIKTSNDRLQNCWKAPFWCF